MQLVHHTWTNISSNSIRHLIANYTRSLFKHVTPPPEKKRSFTQSITIIWNLCERPHNNRTRTPKHQKNPPSFCHNKARQNTPKYTKQNCLIPQRCRKRSSFPSQLSFSIARLLLERLSWSKSINRPPRCCYHDYHVLFLVSSFCLLSYRSQQTVSQQTSDPPSKYARIYTFFAFLSLFCMFLVFFGHLNLYIKTLRCAFGRLRLVKAMPLVFAHGSGRLQLAAWGVSIATVGKAQIGGDQSKQDWNGLICIALKLNLVFRNQKYLNELWPSFGVAIYTHYLYVFSHKAFEGNPSDFLLRSFQSPRKRCAWNRPPLWGRKSLHPAGERWMDAYTSQNESENRSLHTERSKIWMSVDSRHLCANKFANHYKSDLILYCVYLWVVSKLPNFQTPTNKLKQTTSYVQK